MAEAELRCNFKHCRKLLNNYAWVTSCSHIFCEEDGSKHFAHSSTCPSCNTTLTGESDVFRTDLKPTETYKSMVLAGHRPEVLVDIMSRAINFWNYQMYQEKVYHEWVAKKLQDQLSSEQIQYQGMIVKLQTEMEGLKMKLTSSAKETEEVRRRYDDMAEKYNVKVRQFQTLSTSYDTLKRKTSGPNIFGPNSSTNIQNGGNNDGESRNNSFLNNSSAHNASSSTNPTSYADFVAQNPPAPKRKAPGQQQRQFNLLPTNDVPLTAIQPPADKLF